MLKNMEGLPRTLIRQHILIAGIPPLKVPVHLAARHAGRLVLVLLDEHHAINRTIGNVVQKK